MGGTKNKSTKNKACDFTIGRGAFAKISAIEGIYMTKEMFNDFQSFDRDGLSPKDRHDALLKKYSH